MSIIFYLPCKKYYFVLLSSFKIMAFSIDHKIFKLEAYFLTGILIFMLLANCSDVFCGTSFVNYKTDVSKSIVSKKVVIYNFCQHINQQSKKTLKRLSQEVELSYDICQIN